MADIEELRYEVTGEGAALITFNRPDQLNAMTRRMSIETAALLDRADDDPKVRAVIFTGAGRAFCAGADLSSGPSAFSPSPDRGDIQRDWGGVLVLRIFRMLKPTIVAINGPAVGVGATLTLPCDVRIASTQSKFGFVFARRGIIPDACASWFLPRVVGISSALRWCLGGEMVTADQALAAGLISSLHAPPDLLPAAFAVAREFSENTSAVSVALTRSLLWHGLTEPHPMYQHRLESELISFTGSSREAYEGVSSFLQKRPPQFPGSVPGNLPPDWPLWDDPTF